MIDIFKELAMEAPEWVCPVLTASVESVFFSGHGLTSEAEIFSLLEERFSTGEISKYVSEFYINGEFYEREYLFKDGKLKEDLLEKIKKAGF